MVKGRLQEDERGKLSLSEERSLKTDVTKENWQHLAMKHCYMLFSLI